MSSYTDIWGQLVAQGKNPDNPMPNGVRQGDYDKAVAFKDWYKGLTGFETPFTIVPDNPVFRGRYNPPQLGFPEEAEVTELDYTRQVPVLPHEYGHALDQRMPGEALPPEADIAKKWIRLRGFGYDAPSGEIFGRGLWGLFNSQGVPWDKERYKERGTSYFAMLDELQDVSEARESYNKDDWDNKKQNEYSAMVERERYLMDELSKYWTMQATGGEYGPADADPDLSRVYRNVPRGSKVELIKGGKTRKLEW